MDDLDRAVRTVVERCLGVGAGETVLVVADPGNATLGDALLQAARDAVLMILPPDPGRGTEPPATVAAAFAAADVFIAPCLPSLSHTTARKRASDAGARGATMPGVTADLLARLMSADFDAMSARCHAIADPPVLLTVRDGRLEAADGEGGAAFLAHLDVPGPLGRNLAELGVGCNDRATLTGNTLEDEKILGTVHVAFGAGAGIGGTVTVPVHEDVVVLDASLWVGDTHVLDAGRWLRDA